VTARALQICTDHDPHHQTKMRTKLFVLACRSQTHRDEWMYVFEELVPMTPAERREFSWW
jgi:hypothetical protein